MNKPLAEAIAWALWTARRNEEDWEGAEHQMPARTKAANVHLANLVAAARVQVPREPTLEMLIAAQMAPKSMPLDTSYYLGIWRAMYDASPINALRHETED